MRVAHPPPPFPRVPLERPLTLMQEIVCNLLGASMSFGEIASALEITPEMARWHAKNAAARIPGDLPTSDRCRAWARGATLEQLTGEPLKLYLLTPTLRTGGHHKNGDAPYVAPTASTGAP